MEGDPAINQFNRVDLRKTLCAVCKKRLRVPCPKCEERMPCWAYWDKTLGYRHRHCSDREMENKDSLHLLGDDLRKTLCSVCHKRVCIPCPKCEEHTFCWAYWDKTLGYLHRHCSDSRMEKNK